MFCFHTWVFRQCGTKVKHWCFICRLIKSWLIPGILSYIHLLIACYCRHTAHPSPHTVPTLIVTPVLVSLVVVLNNLVEGLLARTLEWRVQCKVPFHIAFCANQVWSVLYMCLAAYYSINTLVAWGWKKLVRVVANTFIIQELHSHLALLACVVVATFYTSSHVRTAWFTVLFVRLKITWLAKTTFPHITGIYWCDCLASGACWFTRLATCLLPVPTVVTWIVTSAAKWQSIDCIHILRSEATTHTVFISQPIHQPRSTPYNISR